MTAEQAPAWAVPMLGGFAAPRGAAMECRGKVGARGACLDSEIAGIEEKLPALTRLPHRLQGKIHPLRGDR